MIPKQPQLRDEKYLAFVRTLPSCISGEGPCEAHHPISKRFSSQKVSDYLAIPLTTDEHRKLHSDWQAWERIHGEQRTHSSNTLVKAIAAGFQFPTLAANTKQRAPAPRGTALTASKILPRNWV